MNENNLRLFEFSQSLIEMYINVVLILFFDKNFSKNAHNNVCKNIAQDWHEDSYKIFEKFKMNDGVYVDIDLQNCISIFLQNFSQFSNDLFEQAMNIVDIVLQYKICEIDNQHIHEMKVDIISNAFGISHDSVIQIINLVIISSEKNKIIKSHNTTMNCIKKTMNCVKVSECSSYDDDERSERNNNSDNRLEFFEEYIPYTSDWTKFHLAFDKICKFRDLYRLKNSKFEVIFSTSDFDFFEKISFALFVDKFVYEELILLILDYISAIEDKKSEIIHCITKLFAKNSFIDINRDCSYTHCKELLHTCSLVSARNLFDIIECIFVIFDKMLLIYADHTIFPNYFKDWFRDLKHMILLIRQSSLVDTEDLLYKKSLSEFADFINQSFLLTRVRFFLKYTLLMYKIFHEISDDYLTLRRISILDPFGQKDLIKDMLFVGDCHEIHEDKCAYFVQESRKSIVHFNICHLINSSNNYLISSVSESEVRRDYVAPVDGDNDNTILVNRNTCLKDSKCNSYIKEYCNDKEDCDDKSAIIDKSIFYKNITLKTSIFENKFLEKSFEEVFLYDILRIKDLDDTNKYVLSNNTRSIFLKWRKEFTFDARMLDLNDFTLVDKIIDDCDCSVTEKFLLKNKIRLIIVNYINSMKRFYECSIWNREDFKMRINCSHFLYLIEDCICDIMSQNESKSSKENHCAEQDDCTFLDEKNSIYNKNKTLVKLKCLSGIKNENVRSILQSFLSEIDIEFVVHDMILQKDGVLVIIFYSFYKNDNYKLIISLLKILIDGQFADYEIYKFDFKAGGVLKKIFCNDHEMATKMDSSSESLFIKKNFSPAAVLSDLEYLSDLKYDSILQNRPFKYIENINSNLDTKDFNKIISFLIWYFGHYLCDCHNK